MALNFSTGALVRYRTSSIAAALFFENDETPSCQPPTVPTDGLLPDFGRTVTSNLPLTGPVWLFA